MRSNLFQQRMFQQGTRNAQLAKLERAVCLRVIFIGVSERVVMTLISCPRTTLWNSPLHIPDQIKEARPRDGWLKGGVVVGALFCFFAARFFCGWLVSARTVPLLQAVAGKN